MKRLCGGDITTKNEGRKKKLTIPDRGSWVLWTELIDKNE